MVSGGRSLTSRTQYTGRPLSTVARQTALALAVAVATLIASSGASAAMRARRSPAKVRTGARLHPRWARAEGVERDVVAAVAKRVEVFDHVIVVVVARGRDVDDPQQAVGGVDRANVEEGAPPGPEALSRGAFAVADLRPAGGTFDMLERGEREVCD